MLTLRPEQLTAAHAMAPESRLLLADVGAGKTAAALQAISRRALLHGFPRTLVLGTKRICNMVWNAEVVKWAPGSTYASVAGLRPTERRDIMTNPYIKIVGLNFENIIWAVNEFGSELPLLFPQLIIDESSKLENPASKSFKTIKPLLPLFDWRLPMTGTPCANHLHDLWGSVYLADCGKALGQYKLAFLQTYFIPVNQRVGIEWVPKFDAKERIYARLENTVHRMPFEWHEPVEIDVLLPLNPTVKKIQDHIVKTLLIEDTVTHDNITYARNGNRVNAKMLQLSSGLIYDDDGYIIALHGDKFAALQEIVDEAKGEPMMVVFQFDHERDGMLAMFPQARLLDNDETLTEWNAGKIEMLLVHPRSCGHGLNAQLSHCDLQVWFTPTTDAELYTQTVGRLNRPGNPKTVRVIRLIMQGTKDRASYSVVAARQRGENATLESFE